MGFGNNSNYGFGGTGNGGGGGSVSNLIDVFLVAGQSNGKGMSGPTGAANSPVPSADTIYQMNPSGLSSATDPVGEGDRQANTGSAWPSFGIAYYNATGRKVCFVPCAKNATSQTAAADTGEGNWSPTGTLFDDSLSRLGVAIADLVLAQYTPVFQGILWCQGENDANSINAGTISQADYQSALTTMIDNYRSALGVSMPFYIFRTGVRTDVSDVGYAAVRNAQVAVANANPLLTQIVFYNAVYFQARGLMVDIVHYTQAGYNEMGFYGAQQVLNAMSNNWQKQAGNLWFPNLIGIGIGLPQTPLDVNGDANSYTARFITNSAFVFCNTFIQNASNGANAAAGIRLGNDLGLGAQIAMVSSNSSAFGGAQAMIFHNIRGTSRICSDVGVELSAGTNSSFTANTKVRVTPAGKVAIGQNPTPDASSVLDVQSTTSGFLPPRMTNAQRLAIATPAIGLMVYQTDATEGLYINKSGGWTFII